MCDRRSSGNYLKDLLIIRSSVQQTNTEYDMSENHGNYVFFSDFDIDAINVDPTDNFFTPVLKEVFKNVGQPQTVCDVGCGNGVFTVNLKNEAGCHLTGVDGSPYALQKASALGFDFLHLVKDFSTDRLPLEDNSFDLVINKDVLEHLLSPENLVQEMARITKPNGYLVVMVPNHFPISGRFRLLVDNTIDPFNYFPNACRWDFPHIRFFNQKDFLLLMRRAGLTPVRCLSNHFPALPKIGRILTKKMRERIARNRPDAFAEAYVWLMQKQ